MIRLSLVRGGATNFLDASTGAPSDVPATSKEEHDYGPDQ
jgi:hypothetical protein